MSRKAELCSPPVKTAARLPDFVLIGARKCGTTSLYDYLREHSHVFMCESKGPCFFSDDDQYDRGESWYRSLFSEAEDSQLCGENSTSYTYWPHVESAPERMHRLMPRAKLIYIMRHPVERTFSDYLYTGRSESALLPFEEELERSPLLVDMSQYMNQIDRYLEFYPRESMLCLLFDDLKKDPSAVLRQIESFLEIGPFDVQSREKRVSNQTIDRYIRERTYKRLFSGRGISALKQVVPKSLRKKLTRTFFKLYRATPSGKRLKSELPALRPEMRARLLERFAASTTRLEEFLGRDLSAWKR